MLCSFLFWPLAAIMGVEIEDARAVAGLIGTKVFADELISFTDLNVMVCNRQIRVPLAHRLNARQSVLHSLSVTTATIETSCTNSVSSVNSLLCAKKCTCTAVVRSAVRKSNIIVFYLCGSSVSCAFGVCIMCFMCIWAKCLK